MTLLQAMKLGDTGQEILDLLKDLKDIANNRGDWAIGKLIEDEEHRAEAIEVTADRIEELLSEL